MQNELLFQFWRFEIFGAIVQKIVCGRKMFGRKKEGGGSCGQTAVLL